MSGPDTPAGCWRSSSTCVWADDEPTHSFQRVVPHVTRMSGVFEPHAQRAPRGKVRREVAMKQPVPRALRHPRHQYRLAIPHPLSHHTVATILGVRRVADAVAATIHAE